jgi:hypothetical protein
MHILDGFDEMRLTQDEIDLFRLFDLYGLDVHTKVSFLLFLLVLEWIFLYSIF